MKIENQSTSFIVETIMGECESIIAETENVYEFLTDMEINTFDIEQLEIDTIRTTAEELQQLVLDFENGITTKKELLEISITLYQDCKYILESVEFENSFLMSDDVAKSFSYMRNSINTIRDTVNIM